MHKSLRAAITFGLFGAIVFGFHGCPPPPSGPDSPDRDRITQAEIDAGIYDIYELMRMGRDLTLHQFVVSEGYGNGRNGATPPNFNRFLGPDSTSCNSCHGLSGIVMGWGTNVANVLVEIDDLANPTVAGSNERQPPMVQGAVWLELLAKEMTQDLRAIRAQAIADAATSGMAETLPLTTKGVDFGMITANPDGTVDTAGVEGCDPDLMIRPMHQKGMASTMRVFARGAFERHFGIQSRDLLLKMDPSRDPAAWDEDEDGVVDELNEAELTAVTLFNASLPAPVETNTGTVDVEAGRALMSSLGCSDCHKSFLTLNDPTFRDVSSTGTVTEVDLLDPLLGLPRLHAESDGSVNVPCWTDLKRHDIGALSNEPLDQPSDNTRPNWDGGGRGESLPYTNPPIPKELMLTLKLWGVGDTVPYFHDGSMPTLEDAILAHDGEAASARIAYQAASNGDQMQLLTFLQQLRVGLVGEVLPVEREASVLEIDPAKMPFNSVTERYIPTK